MKVTIEKLEANAIQAWSDTETRQTTYVTAEATYGGKAHKYFYTLRDGKIFSGSVPYCGSRNRSTSAHGSFVTKVTCGRCW